MLIHYFDRYGLKSGVLLAAATGLVAATLAMAVPSYVGASAFRLKPVPPLPTKLDSETTRNLSQLHAEIDQLRAQLGLDEQAIELYREQVGKLAGTKSAGEQTVHKQASRLRRQPKAAPPATDELKKQLDQLHQVTAYIMDVVGPLDAARSGQQPQDKRPAEVKK